MKLNKLKIKGFVGIDDAEIVFEKPVTLIAGRNNQGKSTIKDAILFGLTGKARAQVKFKDVRNLARGNNGMRVELEYQSGDLPITIKRGISNVSDRVDDRDVTRYCLNPNEFIELSPKDRAKILSQVLGGGMDAVVRDAIATHIGNIDEAILAEIKGNGVNVLEVDELRKAVVEIRRSYKRVLNDLPDNPPLMVDYVDDENYNVETDRESVKKLAERIKKGNEILADAKKMLQDKAAIKDLEKEIKRLEGEIKKLPKLPARVDKEKVNMAPVFMTIQETLISEEAEKCSCPICGHEATAQDVNTQHEELAKWYEKYSDTVTKISEIENHNAEIQFKIETKQEQLRQAKERLAEVEIPKGGEDLLDSLQKERDAAQSRISEYRRYEIDKSTFDESGQRRDSLKSLIDECNRIDEALKDGGPVKADIAAGGKALPINDALLTAWNMSNLSWSSDGMIRLGNVDIEYASESERYRAGCIMGMALAEVSGVGIVALDGYEILVSDNANAFFEAFTVGKLQNALILCSNDKDYKDVKAPEWLSIIQVDGGKITRRL